MSLNLERAAFDKYSSGSPPSMTDSQRDEHELLSVFYVRQDRGLSFCSSTRTKTHEYSPEKISRMWPKLHITSEDKCYLHSFGTVHNISSSSGVES